MREAEPEDHRGYTPCTTTGTVVTDAYTGLYARLLRNSYIEQYDASGAPTLPGYAQLGANNDILAHAVERADLDYYPLWAGQGVGMVNDVRPAGDVVYQLVQEAETVLEQLAALGCESAGSRRWRTPSYGISHHRGYPCS